MMVTPWDLESSQPASGAEPTETEEPKTPKARKSSKSPTAEEHGQAVPVPSATESAAAARSHEEQECQSEAILTSAKLQQDLVVMERILMENIFQPKLAVYRQIPVLIEPVVTSDTEVEEDKDEEDEDEEDEDEEEKQEEGAEPAQSPAEGAGPRLEQLWSYQCDLTWAHSVSSMAWNKVNPWPERIFRCEHGVTAVDFSLTSPNLLAVGTTDGRVAIYDVRSRGDAALLDSSASLNKHKGPVWQLRWVEQDRGAAAGDKGERLMCISGDGRMTQWFIQQRLDCSGEHLKLLSLTPAGILYTSNPTKHFRAAGHPKAARVPQSWLTKPPALCTDVMKIKRTESGKKNLPAPGAAVPPSQDADVFLAGTEESHIYCCSCSGKEQILETYRGHKGPVYKVAWNPSSTDMFLSCSADWSILLWHRDSHSPLLTFTSVTAFVHDIKWAPQSALVFAAVNEKRVEIWDLSVSMLVPCVTSLLLLVLFNSS